MASKSKRGQSRATSRINDRRGTEKVLVEEVRIGDRVYQSGAYREVRTIQERGHDRLAFWFADGTLSGDLHRAGPVYRRTEN
jgi:hypothetical protein